MLDGKSFTYGTLDMKTYYNKKRAKSDGKILKEQKKVMKLNLELER